MHQSDKPRSGEVRVGRRQLLQAGLGGAVLAGLPNGAGAQAAGEDSPFPASRSEPLDRPYNVILIITDEEAYHLRPAEGFATPARDELKRRGTTFLNHYIGSAMCTPSRGSCSPASRRR